MEKFAKHLLNWAIPTDWLHSGEWESCGYSVPIDIRIEFLNSILVPVLEFEVGRFLSGSVHALQWYGVNLF